jgi:glycosyltransferase involved in cell wall biosynthesis
MFSGLRVGVVVPAFNEEHNLPATLLGIPDYVDDVVVVDDGSRDATFAAASRIAEERPGLCIVRHRQNRGVGAAIASGYRRTLELGSDVVVVMAGDGQMDPEDLPRLLSPIARGEADYVKGNRFACAEVWRTMPQTRLFGNIVLSLLTRPASGYWHLFDSQCGFTAASRRALLAIDLSRVYPGYGYPNDLLARLWVAGVRVVDVPVRPIYGPLWRSGISLRTAIYPVLFVVARSFFWRMSVTAAGAAVPTSESPKDPQGPSRHLQAALRSPE